jgi:hypothetical protein
MLYPSRSGVIPFVSRLNTAEGSSLKSDLGTVIIILMVPRSLGDRLVVAS